MKKIFVFMIALAVSGATLQAQTQAQTTIDIDIEGLGDGRVTVEFTTSPELSSQGNPMNIDTLARNGRLVVHPTVEGLNFVSITPKFLDFVIPIDGGMATLSNGGARVEFPLMPGDNIKVRGRVAGSHVEVEITGTEAAIVESELRRSTLPEKVFFDSLHVAITEGDGYGTEEYEGMIREYGDYIEHKYGDGPMPALKWLIEHSDSPVAGYVLAWHSYTIDDMLERDPAMVDRARAGIYGPMIEAKMRFMEVHKMAPGEIVEGDVAPQFTLPTPDGGMLSLADVKKDFIVIDFWASWCGPCISGFPKMKEYYERYGDRLEIVGVATSDNRSAWLGALGKHGLPWMNGLDMDNAVARLYGAQSLPTKVILGPERDVVAIFVGEGEEFYEKLDELLK